MSPFVLLYCDPVMFDGNTQNLKTPLDQKHEDQDPKERSVAGGGGICMCGEGLHQTQGHTSEHSREQDKSKVDAVYLSLGFLAFVNLHL